jgi:hypothetical protein
MVPAELGSLGNILEQVPQFSVIPYPWWRLHAKVTLRKSWISGFNGAPPVVNKYTLPPMISLTLLNTRLSQNGWVWSPVCFNLSNLAATPRRSRAPLRPGVSKLTAIAW